MIKPVPNESGSAHPERSVKIHLAKRLLDAYAGRAVVDAAAAGAWTNDDMANPFFTCVILSNPLHDTAQVFDDDQDASPPVQSFDSELAVALRPNHKLPIADGAGGTDQTTVPFRRHTHHHDSETEDGIAEFGAYLPHRQSAGQSASTPGAFSGSAVRKNAMKLIAMMALLSMNLSLAQDSRPVENAPPGVALSLEIPDPTVDPLEPLSGRATLTYSGEEPLSIADPWLEEFVFEYRRKTQDGESATWLERRIESKGTGTNCTTGPPRRPSPMRTRGWKSALTLFSPGAAVPAPGEKAIIYFASPGCYEVRAKLEFKMTRVMMRSAAVEVTVGAYSELEQSIVDRILSALEVPDFCFAILRGGFDLLRSGRGGLGPYRTACETILREAPDSKFAAAARIVLAYALMMAQPPARDLGRARSLLSQVLESSAAEPLKKMAQSFLDAVQRR